MPISSPAWLPANSPPSATAPATPNNNLLGWWGQTQPTTTAPGSSGTLSGQSYSGAFGNSISTIPGIGGSLEGIIGALYGNKPATADPVTTAGAATSGNIGNLPGINTLTQGADTISAEGAALPFQMNLPNYEGLLGSASTNAGQELDGQLPADVIRQIQQGAAERGISTGQGAGSPDSNAAYLQALGLTSLSQTELGQQNFNQLLQDTPTGPQFNPGTMFVTPTQEQAAAQSANMEAAAPDPQAAGLANTILSFF